MSTDNTTTVRTDERHSAGQTTPVDTAKGGASRSSSSPSVRTVRTGKVVTICGCIVDKITVPYAPQREVERQRNLIANRGMVTSVATSQQADED